MFNYEYHGLASYRSSDASTPANQPRLTKPVATADDERSDAVLFAYSHLNTITTSDCKSCKCSDAGPYNKLDLNTVSTAGEESSDAILPICLEFSTIADAVAEGKHFKSPGAVPLIDVSLNTTTAPDCKHYRSSTAVPATCLAVSAISAVAAQSKHSRSSDAIFFVKFGHDIITAADRKQYGSTNTAMPADLSLGSTATLECKHS